MDIDKILYPVVIYEQELIQLVNSMNEQPTKIECQEVNSIEEEPKRIEYQEVKIDARAEVIKQKNIAKKSTNNSKYLTNDIYWFLKAYIQTQKIVDEPKGLKEYLSRIVKKLAQRPKRTYKNLCLQIIIGESDGEDKINIKNRIQQILLQNKACILRKAQKKGIQNQQEKYQYTKHVELFFQQMGNGTIKQRLKPSGVYKNKKTMQSLVFLDYRDETCQSQKLIQLQGDLSPKGDESQFQNCFQECQYSSK